MNHVPTRPDAPSETACEALFDLYEGATGTVRLGRILRGRDAGRLVVLRPIPPRLVERTRPLIERVRQLAHPKLLKVMGCYRVGGHEYVASEYIAGASLLELKTSLSPGSASEVGVLVRVLHDALLAAHYGCRLLEGIYGYRVERSLYPDTIWVAEFGEAFLTDLAIFESLQMGDAGSGVRGMPYLEQQNRPESDDVRAAGALLFEQLSHRSGDGALSLPTQTNKALANVVHRSTTEELDKGFRGPLAMAKALREVMPGLKASPDDVRLLIRQKLQKTLELRREKLRLLEQNSLVSQDDDRTQFHRACDLESHSDQPTIRPSGPAASGVHPTRPLGKSTPVLSPPPLPRLSVPAPHAPQRASQAAKPSPDDVPTVVPPNDEASDAATTVWVRALDEDSTALYMATKEPPREPSVIIKDHDETHLYLRAKPGALRPALDSDERTSLSDRRFLEELQPTRRLRRQLLGMARFVLLMLASLALTWHLLH